MRHRHMLFNTLGATMNVSATSAKEEAKGPIARRIATLALAAGFAVAVAGPAHAAANLVTNGGFETGDFTGWTQTGNSSFNGVQCPGPGPTVFEGNCSAFFGPVGSTGGISQAINGLATGALYQISFAFEPDGGVPSSFSASFGGTSLLSLTNPPASAYQLLTFNVHATGVSETLAFNFQDDPGFLFLDAARVSVPEPGTLALMGIGLAGLWAGRKRKT
jgi:PEP-CTERM motif